MIQTLKNKFRKIDIIHGSYLHLKRLLLNELVGMTSKSEQNYLAEYGEKVYLGKGEVVDLGCWLGSTTIPLVKGLLKSPAFVGSERKVYAYDLFLWFDWMNLSVAGTNMAGKYREGDNFVEEFENRTKKFGNRIEICAGDLREIGWNGGKIEFLLIDAMKNWDLANSIVRDFYPSLVPHESLILHQDFAHFFTSWIHLLQWRFRENFRFVRQVPKSPSVVFQYKKQIADEFLQQNYSFESFNDEEVESAFDYSMSLISKDFLPNVAAAKVMWFIHQNKREQAKIAFEDLLKKGVKPKKDLLIVQEMITKKSV